MKLRNQVKDRLKRVKKGTQEHQKLQNMQYALKIIANATYGYLAYVGAKWYKRECGASAAAFGRYYISSVVDEAKKQGFNIIYGDTDSLMINYPEKMTKAKTLQIGDKFAKIVNDKLPGVMELEFRDLYDEL